MRQRILLKGGDVVRYGTIEKLDVLFEEGGNGILNIAKEIDPATADHVIDCSGLTIMGGLVDVHVHLREPGFSSKETIATGTAAAAHGGFTMVCSMPNLNPAPDNLENIMQQWQIIHTDAKVKVMPYATITRNRYGKELVDFGSLKNQAVAFSDDGSGVQSDDMMRQAMTEAAKNDAIIAAHCEVNELLRKGYIHDGEYAAKHNHRGICSESEWAQIERDIKLAEESGCQYHVCHISTKESVALIRQAQNNGVKISCETAPHYLTMCDMEIEEDGRFKMNPPIRSAADRDALIEGIKDGTIEIIATDHAPHTADEKSRGLELSAMGVVGLETSFAVIYTKLVREGIISLERAVQLMSENPRRIFKLSPAMRIGAAADIAVFDLNSRYTVDPDKFLSMGRSTPFKGWDLYGECVMTFVEGEIVYERKDKNI